jgi:Transglutaminase-like superfamily
MPRFAECARAACPSYAELALALAGEFAEVDEAAAEARLWRIADAVGEAWAPSDQLELVTATVAGAIAPEPYRPDDDGDFMLDAVLARGHGQPVMLAVIGAEVGARHGIPLGIVSDGRRHLLAHRQVEAPLVADFAVRRLRHPGELGANLRWHCAHQVACALLHALRDRALGRGDLLRAARAAELELTLPFERAARRRARADLIALRAQLN